MKYIKLIVIALIILIVFTAIFQNQDIFNQDYKFQLDFKFFKPLLITLKIMRF